MAGGCVVMSSQRSYDDRATDAILEAVEAEHDFGGWLARVLAAAAAELGASRELSAGRPGSWEADLVYQLVAGTVGYDDESWPSIGGRPGMSEQRDHDAITSISEARERVERARAALKRGEVDLDRRVAGAVSSDPASPTWYAAPGYITHEQAIAAAGLTSALQLHRLMERHAKRSKRR